MKQLLYIGLFILFVTVALLIARPSASCYAPPRTADTVPPYVEPSPDEAPTDSQSEVFKDAGGWVNQREHPLSSNFQANAYAGTDYGTFGPYVSDMGTILSENFTGTEAGTSTGGVDSECLRSVVITNNMNNYGPGTYTIDRNWYDMKVYPPLHVIATGPNNVRQEMMYQTNESCPAWTRLVLDEDDGTKTYTTLTLSTDMSVRTETIPNTEAAVEQRKGFLFNFQPFNEGFGTEFTSPILEQSES